MTDLFGRGALIRHWLWRRQQDLTFWFCFFLDHQWVSYESRGWKTGRDGICREHTWVNFRCARCKLEESSYAQYPIPRTLADDLRSLRHKMWFKWRLFSPKKDDDELPF